MVIKINTILDDYMASGLDSIESVEISEYNPFGSGKTHASPYEIERGGVMLSIIVNDEGHVYNQCILASVVLLDDKGYPL